MLKTSALKRSLRKICILQIDEVHLDYDRLKTQILTYIELTWDLYGTYTDLYGTYTD